MGEKHGAKRKLIIDSIINQAGGKGGTYTHLDVWHVITSQDPDFKRSYFNSYMTKRIIEPGHAIKVKKIGRFWLFRLATSPSKLPTKMGQAPKKLKAKKVASIREVTPEDDIDALTFGERMFIWMNHIRTRANQADADLKTFKQTQERDMKIIRGLQDELSKANKHIKGMEEGLRGKVSGSKYKELLDENRRLKDRLDEQNKQMQEINRRTGSRFNLKDMARFKTG